MSGPTVSEDGFWQLVDEGWIATEKQTLALENGFAPHDAKVDPVVSVPSISSEGTGNTSFFASIKPEHNLYIVSGICLTSVFVSLIIVLTSLSPTTDSLAPPTDCSSNSTYLLTGLQEENCPHELEIASWNIKRFGQSGANNEEKVSEIAGKISDYDIVAVQEIKDLNPGTAPYILQDEIDKISEYGMVLSNRTGTYCEEKSSSQISEQYAFYYDNGTIKSLDSGHHYPNTECEFTREPFAARFVSTEYDHTFVLITLHIDPDDAVNEIDSLSNVFEWAKFQYPDEDDFILLGDLNADCNYASSSQLDELDVRNDDYQWVIPDGTNTNTAVSSTCAYDRIVFDARGSEEYLDSYSTDCEVEVSDHCIISAKFSAHEM